MERETRKDAFGSQNRNSDISSDTEDRLEGYAAGEMADRGPKDITLDRPPRQESDPDISPVTGAYSNPDDDDLADDDDSEDDLVLGDEDDLDDEDTKEVADVEITDADDTDVDPDDDDLVLDADAGLDEEDDDEEDI